MTHLFLVPADCPPLPPGGCRAESRGCDSPGSCTRPRTVLHCPQVDVGLKVEAVTHLGLVPGLGLSSTVPWMDVGLEREVVTHLFLVPGLGLSSTVPWMDVGLEREVVTDLFLVPDLGLSSTVPLMDVGLEVQYRL